MSLSGNHGIMRILVLITNPKLAGKAAELLRAGGAAVPIYNWNAFGTARNAMVDILGLSGPNRSVLFSPVSKAFADEMLDRLDKKLKIGEDRNGIAFTLPISGANNLLVQMVDKLDNDERISSQRKDEFVMTEPKHILIAAILNQGFSEEVMDAVRQAGVGGGTVVHSRGIGSKSSVGLWGMSIQEEKEMLLIVAKKEKKLQIMKIISEQFGMQSKAMGMVLSVPIDSAIGLE